MLWLHFKLIENNFDSMTFRGSKYPDAFLLAGIMVRIIGTLDYPIWRRLNLKFTPALLTVVTIFMQGKAIMTDAHVGADSVSANMCATPIVC